MVEKAENYFFSKVTSMEDSFDVNVVSYNLLTQGYASPYSLPSVDPAILDFNYRINLIKDELGREVEKKAVICLQEVSIRFSSELTSFFQQRDYFYISAPYDGFYSNFMGVAIAFPNSQYNLVTAKIARLADTKSLKGSPKPTFWVKLYQSFINLLVALRLKNKVWWDNYWDMAKVRLNQCITLKLSDKNDEQKQFCIANYHMPCLYFEKRAITIHTALLLQHLSEFAKKTPYILAGDFNTLPECSVYRLITKGKMEKNDPNYPTPIYSDDKWVPTVPSPMKSAYFEHCGSEPEFTNYAHPSGKSTTSFTGTLDYIFCSQNCKVKSVLEMPKLTSPIPSAQYPSDHLLIGTTISVPITPSK